MRFVGTIIVHKYVNYVWGNINCSVLESYDTHKYKAKWSVLFNAESGEAYVGIAAGGLLRSYSLWHSVITSQKQRYSHNVSFLPNTFVLASGKAVLFPYSWRRTSADSSYIVSVFFCIYDISLRRLRRLKLCCYINRVLFFAWTGIESLFLYSYNA